MARRALILANGAFADKRISPLASPRPDAGRLADLLCRDEVGAYEACLCLDADLLRARRQIQEFFDGAQYGDLVLMLISGHGIKDRAGKLHFATSDTDLTALKATSLDAQFIIECLDDSAASKKVMLIDTCYSGAFARDLPGQKSGPAVVTQDDFGNDTRVGKVIITASTAIEIAREDALCGTIASAFSHYLIEGIETGRADLRSVGHINVDDLYRYVRMQLKSANFAQSPQPFYFGIDGSTVIALNPSKTRARSFTFSDVLDHRGLEDIISLTVPCDAGGNVADVCGFIEDFLFSAKVTRKFRHLAGWVACEILANSLSYAPLSNQDSVELKVRAAPGRVSVAALQPDDARFDLNAVLAEPSKADSFMQMMKAAGHHWYTRRHAGRLEIGLDLQLSPKGERRDDRDPSSPWSALMDGVRSVGKRTRLAEIRSAGLGSSMSATAEATVLRASGRIDESSYESFLEILQSGIARSADLGLKTVVIDLKDVSYMSSRGLRAFTLARKAADPAGIQLILWRPNARLREIFAISRYDRIFRIEAAG